MSAINNALHDAIDDHLEKFDLVRPTQARKLAGLPPRADLVEAFGADNVVTISWRGTTLTGVRAAAIANTKSWPSTRQVDGR